MLKHHADAAHYWGHRVAAGTRAAARRRARWMSWCSRQPMRWLRGSYWPHLQQRRCRCETWHCPPWRSASRWRMRSGTLVPWESWHDASTLLCGLVWGTAGVAMLALCLTRIALLVALGCKACSCSRLLRFICLGSASKESSSQTLSVSCTVHSCHGGAVPPSASVGQR